MRDVYDVVVVGGGIVGLASAYKLLLKHPGRSVHVLEKEPAIATQQTDHNSGVIHSGIYYRPGSLKARISVRGALELVRFCEEHGVSYELSGKVIVATQEDERPRLDALLERGQGNGVPELRAITLEELKEIEPHVRGVAALYSPRTGIVSFRAVAESIAAEIGKLGGSVQTGAELIGVTPDAGKLRLRTTAGEMVTSLLIAAAGLQADRVAVIAGSEPTVAILPFRGEYYRLKPSSRRLVRSLIYPVPDPRFPFLGVHFTRRIDGEIEAGPNAVLAFAREGYHKTAFNLRDILEMARFPGTFRMARKYWKTGLDEYYRSVFKSAFVRSLRKLLPEITEQDLERGGAGVRAMALERDGSLVDDFRIVRAERIVHVLNAPSPAATSALAIGDTVAALASEN